MGYEKRNVVELARDPDLDWLPRTFDSFLHPGHRLLRDHDHVITNVAHARENVVHRPFPTAQRNIALLIGDGSDLFAERTNGAFRIANLQ
jgi:hypothetical protein